MINLKSDKKSLDRLAYNFKSLDKNKDGKLSKEEIRAGIEADMGELIFTFGAKKVDFIDELFAVIDVNKDGTIDYDEFIRAGYSQSELINKKNLKMAFKAVDYDGDGSIDIKELKTAFSNGVMESLSSSH